MAAVPPLTVESDGKATLLLCHAFKPGASLRLVQSEERARFVSRASVQVRFKGQ
jgi:hypothetical protein